MAPPDESSKGQGLQEVYANVVNFHGSPFDIAMDFGSRVGDEEPDYRVRVTMSWQHLKLMLAVLQEQVANYEAQVGHIPNLVAGQPEDDQ
jgi:hypothetical protein